MRKLTLNEEIETKHLKYFKENIASKFDKVPRASNPSKQICIKKFFDYLKTNTTDIAIGKPSILRQLSNEIKLLDAEILEIDIYISDENKSKKLKEYLNEIFNYEKFSKTPKNLAKETITMKNFKTIKSTLFSSWNAYNFVFCSGIKVCPYCNRQYITPIYIQESNSIGHRLRADLDHFYPKIEYPYLSMSLYNLVPCCKFCNSSLKGDKIIQFEDVNPYENSFDNYFKFRYDVIEEEIYIQKNEKKEGEFDNLLEIFQTEALYSYHENIVNELLTKKKIYPDSHIKELFNNHSELFSNERGVLELIFGTKYDKVQLNDEVLMKFKNDLAEQFEIM